MFSLAKGSSTNGFKVGGCVCNFVTLVSNIFVLKIVTLEESW